MKNITSYIVFLLLSFHGEAFAGNDSVSVVLRFAGDCLLTDHYERVVGNDAGYAFRGFDLLAEADVAMVNLECPITVRGKPQEKPFAFRMNPDFVPALAIAGIDIVNLANNHIYDFGDIGLFDTICYLDSAGIAHVGAGGVRKKAHAPVIYQLRGHRVAMLGYYGGGEAPGATDTSAGVARRNLSLIRNDIKSILAADPDTYVVVNLHWGTEKEEYPDESQIRFAHGIIDAGARAVIGHHPHVLQGIERYKDGVIAYSLGNFIFGGNSRSTYQTGIFEIQLRQSDVQFVFVPVQVSNWQASLLDEPVSNEVLARMKELSGIFPHSIFSEKEKR